MTWLAPRCIGTDRDTVCASTIVRAKVDGLARSWEPRPLRFMGVHGIYAMYRKADLREGRTRAPSRLARLADQISVR